MKKPAGFDPVLWIPFGLVAGVVIGAILGNVGYGVAVGIVAGGALAAILRRGHTGQADQHDSKPNKPQT